MLFKKRKPIKLNRRLKEPLKVRARRTVPAVVKTVAFILSFPALVYSAWTLYCEAVTTPFLAVNSVNVSGVVRVAKDEVVKLSGIQGGQNIFSFRKEDVSGFILKNPWIASAEVNRELPGTVEITVIEREPVALVKMDALYIMDSNGNVFKKVSNEEALDLPIVTGLTVQEGAGGVRAAEDGLLELINFLRNRNGFNLNNVSEINVDPFYGFSVYTLDEGIRLEIGRDRFKEKLDAYDRIIRKRKGDLNGIEAMDLNNEREVIVRFTTNVIKEGGAV